MEMVSNSKDSKMLKENKIIGNLKLENSEIKFLGDNNFLYLVGTVNLLNTKIEFRGNNSIVYLCESDDIYSLDLKIYNNSVFYFGKNNWINRLLKVVVSEQTNVIFGNDNLISYDICIRTADPHLIYDVSTKQRINNSKSILVGDHVWLGQHAFILKGTQIGSGSVVGAMSLLTNKKYRSNTIYAGNPARAKKEGIFFIKPNAHRFLDDDIEEYKNYNSNEFIYEKDDFSIDFNDIDIFLHKSSLKSKLNYLNEITNNNHKNRFYIE